MQTTYKNVTIITSFDNGKAVHKVNDHEFATMLAAMSYVDRLARVK